MALLWTAAGVPTFQRLSLTSPPFPGLPEPKVLSERLQAQWIEHPCRNEAGAGWGLGRSPPSVPPTFQLQPQKGSLQGSGRPGRAWRRFFRYRGNGEQSPGLPVAAQRVKA